MSKAVIAIAQDFIGEHRRPYLVADVPGSVAQGPEMGARGAAIQGLMPFASQLTYCMNPDGDGSLVLDRDKLLEFARAHRDSPVLVYGFTYILWQHLVKPLLAESISLEMPNVHVLHSGGWKRLQDEAVDKASFNRGVAQVFACAPGRVIDFYGMVENVGVIYPDCAEGNKHVPAFAECHRARPADPRARRRREARYGAGLQRAADQLSRPSSSYRGCRGDRWRSMDAPAAGAARLPLRRPRAESRDARLRQPHPKPSGTGSRLNGNLYTPN